MSDWTTPSSRPLLPLICSEVRLDQSASQVKRPGDTVKMSCVISGYSMTITIFKVKQRKSIQISICRLVADKQH
uniref:Ig-like domain-containing protein n=1 Tax=Cyprinodon variegatus TaxID=28743 RepID=A0A3Q2DYS5_CYPVA